MQNTILVKMTRYRRFSGAWLALLLALSSLVGFSCAPGMENCPAEALQFKTYCQADADKKARLRQVLLLALLNPAGGTVSTAETGECNGEDGGCEIGGN